MKGKQDEVAHVLWLIIQYRHMLLLRNPCILCPYLLSKHTWRSRDRITKTVLHQRTIVVLVKQRPWTLWSTSPWLSSTFGLCMCVCVSAHLNVAGRDIQNVYRWWHSSQACSETFKWLYVRKHCTDTHKHAHTLPSALYPLVCSYTNCAQRPIIPCLCQSNSFESRAINCFSFHHYQGLGLYIQTR